MIAFQILSMIPLSATAVGALVLCSIVDVGANDDEIEPIELTGI
jgi:hypothetical protein